LAGVTGFNNQLLCFTVRPMGSATGTVFSLFHPVRIILFIFGRHIIA
jgi:hypothetical protein